MAKQRNEIEEKYTWDLSTIFPTDEAFETELAQVSKELKNASNLENIKVKKTGTKTAGAKVAGEKLSEKTTKNSKTKTAESPKTNKSKGKVN